MPTNAYIFAYVSTNTNDLGPVCPVQDWCKVDARPVQYAPDPMPKPRLGLARSQPL